MACGWNFENGDGAEIGAFAHNAGSHKQLWRDGSCNKKSEIKCSNVCSNSVR